MRQSFIELPQGVRQKIDEIRSNNTSGAVELAKQAAEALLLLAEDMEVSPASLFPSHLVAAARALIDAQPAMAPIFHLANQALQETGTLHEPEEIRRVVRATCLNFIDRLRRASQTIAAMAANLIHDGTAVMTHSYSSTVLEALLLARSKGKQFTVFSTESRPMREGIALASRLGREGIAVTLIVDAAMKTFLPQIRLVLVGADSVSLRGLVNKIGTSLLALAAKASHVDVYALCGTEKMLPAGSSVPSEEPKKPGEVVAERLPNVTVKNYYFDLTPLDFLAGVVTEEGIIKPAEVLARLARLRVHEALR